MDRYFKPRRRKIGLVTLVAAVAVTGLWLRSHVRNDTFTIAKFNRQLGRFVSRNEGLLLEVHQSEHPILVDGTMVSIADKKSSDWKYPFHYTLQDPKSLEPVTLLN